MFGHSPTTRGRCGRCAWAGFVGLRAVGADGIGIFLSGSNRRQSRRRTPSLSIWFDAVWGLLPHGKSA